MPSPCQTGQQGFASLSAAAGVRTRGSLPIAVIGLGKRPPKKPLMSASAKTPSLVVW
ncbi:hypothetical protein [Sulfitobacter sp. SK011]|uniref:hypothetical protein n=1 Tax=Sulfitobacter sp. SK011 TaxID=1389004 RepID=UPI0013B43918|nr:hypothetical protein [Sulfitobacter sp. SK011]